MDSVSTIVMPDITNHMGIMHGGEVIKMMDNASGVAAARHAGANVVTAHIETDFFSKIELGEYVSAEASVVYTGKRAMVVYTAIYATGIGKSKRKAAEGYYVMVSTGTSAVPEVKDAPKEQAKKALEIYKRNKK